MLRYLYTCLIFLCLQAPVAYGLFENRNYGFIPKTTAPEGVDERTHALEGLYYYCNSDRDEECRGKSEEMFGETVSLTDDAKTRNSFIGRALTAHNGFIGKPDAYIKAAGMEFPAKFKNAGDLYEAIGAGFHEKMREKYDQIQRDKALTQGLDALIAGWALDAPYPQTSRQRAIAAFGKTWVKVYETSTLATQRALASQACQQHLGQTDWETYKNSRIEHTRSLKRITLTEKQAYQAKQEQARQQKRQQKLSKTLRLTGRAAVIASAIGLLITLYHTAKRRVAVWQYPEWASLITSILLAIAILSGESWFHWLDWSPYRLTNGYYTILRLAVTATAILLICRAAKAKAHHLRIILWASIALLYQPLVRVELHKDAWLIIDLILMILLLCAMYCNKAGKPENEQT